METDKGGADRGAEGKNILDHETVWAALPVIFHAAAFVKKGDAGILAGDGRMMRY